MTRFFRLFFRSASPQPVPRVAPPAQQVTPRDTGASAASKLFIGWNEMIDGGSRIAGYLLRPRHVRAEKSPTTQELLTALKAEGVFQFAQRRPIILPVTPEQWQSSEFLPLSAPQLFYLIEDTLPAAEHAPLLQAIKTSGAKVAMACTFDQEAAIMGADLLIFDFLSLPLHVLEEKISALRQRHPEVILVAYGVGSWSEHRLCQSLGVRYCMGTFATAIDDADQSERLSQSRLVAIELLNLLRRNAETSEITATAKRDPAIVLHTLQMANSTLNGVSHQVTSIEEAILLLGRDVLYRCLATSLFKTNGQAGRAKVAAD